MLLSEFCIFSSEFELVLPYVFGCFAEFLFEDLSFTLSSLQFLFVVIEGRATLFYFEHGVNLAPQVLIN